MLYDERNWTTSKLSNNIVNCVKKNLSLTNLKKHKQTVSDLEKSILHDCQYSSSAQKYTVWASALNKLSANLI